MTLPTLFFIFISFFTFSLFVFGHNFTVKFRYSPLMFLPIYLIIFSPSSPICKRKQQICNDCHYIVDQFWYSNVIGSVSTTLKSIISIKINWDENSFKLPVLFQIISLCCRNIMKMSLHWQHCYKTGNLSWFVSFNILDW